MIIQGDCRSIIPMLGEFDFIFADPPFNIGQEYNGYDDRRSDFDEFTQEWIRVAWAACRGVLALHGPDDLAEQYLIAARRLGMRRITWVNWHYRFGQCNPYNWIDSRCHCLIFAKNQTHTWNPDAVRVPSDRKAKYKDKRIENYPSGGSRVPFTVWGIESDGEYWGRVVDPNKERCSHSPNQLPELYLARLIKAYTNTGDRVLDPFGGSGTTYAVGTALGRECVTIDISPVTCEGIRDRVKRGAVRV